MATKAPQNYLEAKLKSLRGAVMKILLVDDDPETRGFMRQSLTAFEHEGHRILEEADGEAALDTICLERPHLVFMDIVMGDVNGFYICHLVKQRLKIDTRIILVTSRLDAFDQQRGTIAGADGYIEKPLGAHDISKIARSTIESTVSSESLFNRPPSWHWLPSTNQAC